MGKEHFIAVHTVKVGGKYHAPGETLPALNPDVRDTLLERGDIANVGTSITDAPGSRDAQDKAPHELSVDELKLHLQTVADETVLEELHNAEREHKNRTTALEAIEARMVELDQADEDD